MYTQAMHNEMIETLSPSCFVSVPIKFFIIGGPVKQLYLDYGMIFLAVCQELEMDGSCSDSQSMVYLQVQK